MKKLLLFLIGAFISTSIYSQAELKVFEDWTTLAGTQNMFQKNITKTDAGNNVYVAGATMNASGNYDIFVSKYDDKGPLLWVYQKNGDANYHDFATGLYVSDSGDVVVTGGVVNDTTFQFSDIFTVKLDGTSGSEEWFMTYDGAGSLHDSGGDVIVSDAGEIYVVGTGFNSNPDADFIALKYSSIGTLAWSSSFDYQGMNDYGVKITATTSDVFICGAGQTTSIDYDAIGFILKKSDGTGTGDYAYYGGTIGADIISDVTRDSDGNYYICGGVPTLSDGYDMYLIKLDSNLVSLWEVTYNGADGLDDVANGVRVDADGTVYIAGYETNTATQTDWIVRSYDSGGSFESTRGYNDTLDGKDEALSMELTPAGDVVVSGFSYTSINEKDFYTVKYDSTLTPIWGVYADGNSHLDDKATNIAIDDNGDIIVTGQSLKRDGSYEYKTVKYIEKNIITPTDFNSETPASSFAYYENKGQLLNTNDSLVPDIRYYTTANYPDFFIRDKGFSFVFTHADTVLSTTDTLHRIDLGFNGNVTPTAKVYPLEQRSDYINYFLGHAPEGITGIHANNRLVTPNLYNNIDLEYSSNVNGLKYYFIVKPGGSPTGIQMEYTGASSFNLDTTTHTLTINSSIGSLTFDRPTVYQVNSSNVIVPITGWYADWQTNGASNKYKFNIGTYDNTKALIIEVDLGNTASSPSAVENLSWSTYYGGGKDDYLTESTTDLHNYLYIGGETQSVNFPNVSGTYQGTNVGLQDAVALKFNYLGQIQWATYLGGSTMETTGGIAVNPATKAIYLVGSTSSGDFPTALGNPGGGAMFDNTLGNTNFYDGYICKLDSTGQVAPWRTYFGGSYDDWFYSAELDASGNLFVVGKTANALSSIHPGSSYTQSCVTGGAGAADQDGIILKFGSTGVPLWQTCYGGSYPNEYVSDLDIDNNGYVYVVGTAWTPSGGFPTLDPAGGSEYYDASLSGQDDAFIAKFDNSGTRIWATLFGGNALEQGNAISVTPSGDIYVGGATTSSDSTFVKHKPGAYNCPYNGTAYDGFLLKLNSNLSRDWATYYGGVNNDFVYSMKYDKNNNVLYLTGQTESSNLPYYYVANHAGVYDQAYTTGVNSYIAAFDENQKNVWVSLLGGSKNDFGYSVTTDNLDHLFIVGKTTSDHAASVTFPLYDDLGVPYFDGIWDGFNAAIHDGTITRFDVPYTTIIGIQDTNDPASGLYIYPNPASSSLNIRYEKQDNSSVVINVFNLLGGIIKSTKIDQQGSIFHTFDTSGLSDGVYFVQIIDNNKTITKKFLKQ